MFAWAAGAGSERGEGGDVLASSVDPPASIAAVHGIGVPASFAAEGGAGSTTATGPGAAAASTISLGTELDGARGGSPSQAPTALARTSKTTRDSIWVWERR